MGFFNSRMTDFLNSALGRKKPIKKQEPRRFVPWIEALEDRRLLSISFTTVPGTQTNYDGAAITGVQTVATDTAADQVVYSQSGLPSGLTLNSSSGLITGTISTSADASSPYTVNLTATDQVTNEQATASFTWNVNADPITFVNPGTQTNDDGATISLATGGSDSQPNSLTYTATGLPNGLSIDSSTGKITGTIHAIDNISGVTNTVNPTITTTTADNLVIGESVTISGVGGATGVNGTFVVATIPTTTTFTITDATAPGAYTSGGTVDPNYSVTVTASDATANASNSETFAWDVNPTPVTVTAPATQTNDDGAEVSVQVQATDSISGHTLVYSASNLPSGLSINTSTGLITGEIGTTANTGSPYTVTVTATDATANTSASQNFTWDVTTGPITLTNPGNQTNTGLNVVKLQLSATDSTAGDSLTYSATGLPTGLSINQATGLISGTIAESANSGSPYSTVVTATDNTANTSNSQSFTWTVNPGPINGVVFFDSNGNGKLDSTDPRLAGVTVQLTGTADTIVNISGVTDTVDPTITTATADNLSVGNSITIANVGGATGVNGTFTVASIISETSFTILTTTAPGTYTSGGTITTTEPISVSCVTNASGTFSFVNPPVGTYTVKVDPIAALTNGKPSIASLVSPSGVTVTNSNTPVAGKVTGGLSSTAISLGEFLTTTEGLNRPFGPVGTGVATVDNAPTVSKAIAAVSLTSSSTTSTVDLAGHFTDADLSDSSITMNITDGLTAVDIKNVTNTVNPTITTTTAHNLAVGDSVTISGIQGATGVNGTFTVASVPTSTTFTITDATAPGVYIPGGTVTGTLNISGVTNTVNPKITTTTANKLTVGESVTIAGVVGATGVNGTFTVASVPTSTTFTITDATAPGTYTAGGTVGTPAIDISAVTNTVNPTITTTTANKLVVGELISIAGVVGATGVNGTFTVASVPTATTFTIKDTTAPGAYKPAGSLTASDSITGVTNVIDPTITTSSAHHLQVGDMVTISGVVGATGVNGTFAVTSVPTATTFTIATASAPGVYVADGAVSTLLMEKLNVTLFDPTAPQTVANFMDYIKSGEYNNSIFSRLVQNFVLQGGGATFTPASGSTSASISSIAIGPTIPNEFKTPNTIDTLAMAQSSGNDASATDQFFINIANNSATSTGTNLDAQNFAVFGKVDSDSTAALAALTATPTLDASGSTAATANSTVDMSNIPLTGYTAGTSTATSSSFAADANSTNFMTINSVTIDKEADYLTYKVSSSNSSIVAASLDSVHNEQLTLTRGTATGTATVTVTATDRYGLSVTSTITVTVS